MLRRRLAKDDDVQQTKDKSRDDKGKSSPDTKTVVIQEKPQSGSFFSRPKSKRRNGLIFALGGIFGIFVALFFANQQDVISLESLMDLNLDTLIDVIPQGIIRDAREFTQHERDAVSYDPFSVGLQLQAQGIEAKHPIVMIPGVISTGLESWGTGPASRQYFRRRLWGSWSMMRALVMDKAEWKNHIMLDRETGLDPPGIKLRAAQGFDATDFFITGYWIWNKILENLATIGYDPTNAFTAAYDWRLSYLNLEVRDQYFSRLKSYIETAVLVKGEKVTLASHSMGSQVVLYFFKWVEHPDHGKGGRDWVNKHIANWINISGCMLGAVKGLTAVLSGEMRDTAQLNAFAVYGLEKFLSKEERAEIFRAMPGISSMLPKGGEAVWGNSTWAPDDQPGQVMTFGNLLNFRETNSSWTRKNLTTTESLTYLLDQSEDWYRHQVLSSYSHGVAHTTKEVEANENDPRTWLNPLETRLPLAPDMKIYCFYGVGKPTERSYFYQEERDPLVNLNVSIDTTVTTPDGVDRGVLMGEGDGTVNLLSTGYMCAKGWHIKRYNPAGVKIKVFEMPHEPDRFSPRGGPNTGIFLFCLIQSSIPWVTD
ncbi:phospholipid:diacylglycerol acyltransferase [Aspergillus fumigatus Af293]|uniref:Phospholipid:diacylglycerol acyltransferase, putative n=2 Tax=Aspergillus fumigatus TaxID=746128 RepID=Q4WXL7_ASPFU|nr:Phospholipid:diacylglycerol acyltransferase, putative [Aspergillus fumigatus Af293]EAL92586.1 Phospholipid:diacylglycerol acyltransferase, putative [Aspergillus fumigatus Af293]EDP52753.1 Phospholipid:diacylglycerol acyltransferase, putative [Aspergillus fumigatus A1163]